YKADETCQMLRTLKSRSAQLRVTGWREGSESYFNNLAREQPWPMLEVVELSNLRVDNLQIRATLNMLPKLESVKLENLVHITDAIFENDGYGAPFPKIKALSIEKCAGITLAGLTTYLVLQGDKPVLERLTIKKNGVTPDNLNAILSIARSLRYISLTCEVT